ncbi:MAG TPA: hypothetical protein DFS52_13125 [Myxococcales bacterium]|jgi:hypothetical protein|nr:hypothetical protein [Myxococcales bacterium]
MRARLFIPFLLGLVAAKLALDHICDVDLMWHLRIGLDILERGAIPPTVEYTWTVKDTPYLANDWLAQILFALAFKAGGLVGVGLFKALLVVGIVTTLYLVSLERAEGNRPSAGLAVGVMLFVAAANFIARPLLFGQLCLALELLLIERALKGKRWVPLAMPVLFAFWINTHGSWAVGLGPLAVAGGTVLLPFHRWRLTSRPVEKAARLPVLLSLLAPLGVVLNPIAWKALIRPFDLIAKQGEFTIIDEWAPVPWSDPSAWILIGAALLFVVAAARSRKPLPLYELGLVGLTFVMALQASRQLSIFAIIAAPPLAEQLASRMRTEMFRRPRTNAIVAALAAVALGLMGGLRLASVDREARGLFPVDGLAQLEQSGFARRPGFHFFEWGGYLVFHKLDSFIDGRLGPFYEAGLFDEYLRIERQGDVEAIEQRGVCWALLVPGTPLAEALGSRAGWKRHFEDDLSVLWLRSGCAAQK